MCVCVYVCVSELLLPAGGALVLQTGKTFQKQKEIPTDQTVSLSTALSSAARVCTVRVHIGESSVPVAA